MADPMTNPIDELAGPVTSENAAALGSFSEHRKVATTRISDFTVPPGVPYQTPEGLRAEDEETRIAFDVQGGVYPIRESVFKASYQPASEAVCSDCGLPERLHGSAPGEPPNPTRSNHRFRSASNVSEGLRAQLRETGLAYHTFNGRCTTDWPSCENTICVGTRKALDAARSTSVPASNENPRDAYQRGFRDGRKSAETVARSVPASNVSEGLREAALKIKAKHDAEGHSEPCDLCAALAQPDATEEAGQSCRFVGRTRPWCVIHHDWWASEGRCGSAQPDATEEAGR